MIERIEDLLNSGKSFSFKTTLSGSSYVKLIDNAKENGYKIVLLYLYAGDTEINIKRIENRVKEGGHDVPAADVKRRFVRGIKKLFTDYMPLCDVISVYSVSDGFFEPVFYKNGNDEKIYTEDIWQTIKGISDD